MAGVKYNRTLKDESDKASLVREIQQEFEKDSAVVAEPGTVQRYSESTKTLYSSEEEAIRKIASNNPQFGREEEKKELTIDEMFQLLADDRKSKEKIVHKGYAVVENDGGKWRT